MALIQKVDRLQISCPPAAGQQYHPVPNPALHYSPGCVQCVHLVASEQCGDCRADLCVLLCCACCAAGLFPCILGHEAAGVVESVGEGVTSVKPGEITICTWRDLSTTLPVVLFQSKVVMSTLPPLQREFWLGLGFRVVRVEWNHEAHQKQLVAAAATGSEAVATFAQVQ